MHKSCKPTLALLLCWSIFAYASGNSFKVRYNGGSVASKVDPKDWDNKLTIAGDAITLALKDKVSVSIPPKSVTSLSYGQEAHRRVGTMVALAVLVAPVALFGLFHKTRLHYIGIQYKTPEGKEAGILLQGDKDNYRAILVALQGVTGAPVSVAEKDREFVPVGVATNVTKGSEESASSGQPTNGNAALPVSSSSSAQIDISSTPSGADIDIDGKFVGSTPSSIAVAPGDHDITVKKTGFAVWSRKITTSSGHDNISAELAQGTVIATAGTSSIAAPTSLPTTPPQATAVSGGGSLGITGADWDQGGIRGVQIVDVFNNGSAHFAGLHKGDIITQLNGRDISSAQFLVRVLASMEPGTSVRIGYLVKTDLIWMPRETVAILAKME